MSAILHLVISFVCCIYGFQVFSVPIGAFGCVIMQPTINNIHCFPQYWQRITKINKKSYNIIHTQPLIHVP